MYTYHVQKHIYAACLCHTYLYVQHNLFYGRLHSLTIHSLGKMRLPAPQTMGAPVKPALCCCQPLEPAVMGLWRWVPLTFVSGPLGSRVPCSEGMNSGHEKKNKVLPWLDISEPFLGESFVFPEKRKSHSACGSPIPRWDPVTIKDFWGDIGLLDVTNISYNV